MTVATASKNLVDLTPALKVLPAPAKVEPKPTPTTTPKVKVKVKVKVKAKGRGFVMLVGLTDASPKADQVDDYYRDRCNDLEKSLKCQERMSLGYYRWQLGEVIELREQSSKKKRSKKVFLEWLRLNKDVGDKCHKIFKKFKREQAKSMGWSEMVKAVYKSQDGGKGGGFTGAGGGIYGSKKWTGQQVAEATQSAKTRVHLLNNNSNIEYDSVDANSCKEIIVEAVGAQVQFASIIAKAEARIDSLLGNGKGADYTKSVS